MNCGICSSKKRTDKSWQTEIDKRRNTNRKKKHETIERANRTAWLLDEKIFAKAMEREGSSRWLIHFTSFWIIWGSLKIGIREKSMIYHHVPLLEYITLLFWGSHHVGNKTILQTSKDTLKIVADFHKVRDQGRGCARMVPKWVKALGCDVSFPMNKML
jgi:hypothetical protein